MESINGYVFFLKAPWQQLRQHACPLTKQLSSKNLSVYCFLFLPCPCFQAPRLASTLSACPFSALGSLAWLSRGWGRRRDEVLTPAPSGLGHSLRVPPLTLPQAPQTILLQFLTSALREHLPLKTPSSEMHPQTQMTSRQHSLERAHSETLRAPPLNWGGWSLCALAHRGSPRT